MFFAFWIVSIFLVALLAYEKKRNAAAWVALSIFTGPLALIIVAFLPYYKTQSKSLPEYYGSEISPLSLKLQLEEIKNEFQGLINKLYNLEVKINSLRDDNSPDNPPVAELIRAQSGEDVLNQKLEENVRPEEYLPKPEEKSKDLEINLGKFWLNKIGIIIFALGIGFLITYAFKYFGPLARIVFGYAVCCVLFFFGFNFEKKEKFLYFGRVLLGGAWALIYFTTYAMYHFEASKIIFSQPLELLLLAIVVAGLIWHSLCYKSEVLTAIAFFIGYLTSTVGDISFFTLSSSFLLALAILVVVYRLQWARFIFLGIALTYLTHLSWVVKHLVLSPVTVGVLNVKNVYFLLDAGFISIYWFLFITAVHLIKDQNQEDKLAAANFSNFLFYFLLVFPKLQVFYPGCKFNFVLGLGAVYALFSGLGELTKRRKLLISNIVIAVSLLSVAVYLKFIFYHVTIIWFIELPFLLFIGLVFQRRVYRYLSIALAWVLFFRFFFWSGFGSTGLVVFNTLISWSELLSLFGAVSMAVSYGLYQFGKKKLESAQELNWANFFSALAVFYLTSFIWEFSFNRWLTLNVQAVALLILLCGVLMRDKYLRYYSLPLFLIAAVRFCVIDDYSRLGNVGQWILVSLTLVLAYAGYAIYRFLKNKSLLDPQERFVPAALFFAATFLTAAANFHYIPRVWISLSLGIAGVMFFGLGFVFKDKLFRVGGFIIFAITLARIIFVDFSGLAVIYKIISFIVLGIFFLGVSYFYTRSSLKKKEVKNENS